MKRARSELCQYQSEWASTNIPTAAVDVMKNVARLDMNRAFRLLSVQVNDRIGDRCQVRTKPYKISRTHTHQFESSFPPHTSSFSGLRLSKRAQIVPF